MGQKKALFLDRDGVINVESGYIWREEDFIFTDGVFDACRRAAAMDYLLLVVTNQAGIGRGLFSEEEFQALMSWVCGRFRDEGVEIARVYHAPTHPEFGVGVYKRDSPERKPGPGMFLRGKAEFDLDMAASVIVGDRETDMLAGEAAGVGTKIIIEGEEPDLSATRADRIVSSLPEAIAWLEERAKSGAA